MNRHVKQVRNLTKLIVLLFFSYFLIKNQQIPTLFVSQIIINK